MSEIATDTPKVSQINVDILNLKLNDLNQSFINRLGSKLGNDEQLRGLLTDGFKTGKIAITLDEKGVGTLDIKVDDEEQPQNLKIKNSDQVAYLIDLQRKAKSSEDK